MKRVSRVLVVVAALLMVVPPLRLGAQVVRGVVRDSATGAPMPGVIVALDEAVAQLDTDGSLRRASLVLAVLTNERGEFAVRAGFAGRFVLSAKRVGSQRFVSRTFDLAIGEQRVLNFSLSEIDFTATLPQVTTLTDAPCSVRPEQRERVAAAWEEARAALTASRLALRDRLFRASITRYVRDLRPVSLRVIREERFTRHGVTERAFASLAADRLSADGYVQQDAEGAWTFHAPDAAVLTSTDFLRDHCFSIVQDARRHGGQVGLAFDPVRTRRRPDLRGALWLDSATAELRLVEFTYVNLDESLRRDAARGEVHFARAANGSWFVKRWFIRMPQYARTARPSPLIVRDGSVRDLVHYREEGGDVRVTDGVETAPLAALRGVIMDSTGQAPLRNATVRLAGTQFTGQARHDGTFRLDSVPAGAYTLIVEHPDYHALGMLAGEQELEIAEATETVTAVEASGTETVLRQICGRNLFEPGRSVLRVLVRTTNGAVVPDVEVRTRYHTFEARPGGVARVPNTEKVGSDDLGAATFCSLPPGVAVEVEFDDASGENVRREVRLNPQAVSVITFIR